MKAPCVLLLGGRSPVVAYLSDSIMVCHVLVNVSTLPHGYATTTYSLSRAVPAYNEGKGRIELYGLSFFGPK